MAFITRKGATAATLIRARSPAIRQGAADGHFSRFGECQVATPRLARLHILHPLSAVAPRRAGILPGQEVHFHIIGMPANLHGAEEDERLLALAVAAPEQELKDRLIACLTQRMMVERQVHVQAACMRAPGCAQQKLRDPAPHDDDPLLVFPQQPGELQHDAARRFHGFGSVISPLCYHDASMPFRSACAASSPRPR